jgi:hypothetical protein
MNMAKKAAEPLSDNRVLAGPGKRHQLPSLASIAISRCECGDALHIARPHTGKHGSPHGQRSVAAA